MNAVSGVDGVSVIVGQTTVIESVRDPGQLLSSITVTLKTDFPVEGAFPLMKPEEESDIPAGSVPPDTTNVYGACPPVAPYEKE